MAEWLLNRAVFRVAGIPFRLTEIEFYAHGHLHNDPFSHCDPIQKQGGSWYFHRTGGRYRSGTYKGLDVVIGNESLFGAILFRSMVRLDFGFKLLDGPCVCVDSILDLCGMNSIGQLASSFDLSADRPTKGSSLLFLEEATSPRSQAIYVSPRVGLTLKKGIEKERQRFLIYNYRFLTEPQAIKKGRPYLILSLYKSGYTSTEISKLTSTSVAIIERYIIAYHRGLERSAESYRKDLSSEQLCELLGVCEKAK